MERLPCAMSFMLALSACLRRDGAFHCEDDAQCGAGGQCEMSSHFCSFVDTSCSSGRRYGEFSGPEATHCVTDGPREPGEPLEPPRFISEAHHRVEATDALDYELMVPAGERRFLLVAVQVGSLCAPPIPPTPETSSVSFDGVLLERVKEVSGTPGCETGTRSEQWKLIDPHVGAHLVRVQLKGSASTVHSAALSFAGVNQILPVRETAAARGGTGGERMPQVTVSSAADDLVVNTVGHGTGIVQPDAPCDKRFLNNVSTSTTLDNSAACTAPGAAQVTITWQVNGNDEWQTISSSLQP